MVKVAFVLSLVSESVMNQCEVWPDIYIYIHTKVRINYTKCSNNNNIVEAKFEAQTKMLPLDWHFLFSTEQPHSVVSDIPLEPSLDQSHQSSEIIQRHTQHNFILV